MRVTRRRLLWSIAVLAAAGGIWVLVRPEPIAVDVAVVSRGTLRETIDEPALTRAPYHAELTAPVPGRLANALVQAGDSVRAGQVLAVLHPAPLDARSAAEGAAAVRAAEGVRDAAVAAERQVLVVLEEARRDLERAQRLAAEGGIAARDLDAAKDAVSSREREHDAARARGRAAAEELQRARIATRDPGSLTPVELRAPMAGRVLRLFEEHDRVVPAGTPLVEVGDPSRLEAIMEVLSRDAARISVGMPARLRLPSGDTVPARVTRLEPAAFTRTSALGIDEQRVRVAVQPERALVGIGDRFELEGAIVVWESSDAVRVPASALLPLDSGWVAYAIADDRVRARPLRLGHRGAREVEIREGLSAGERIVLLPDARLKDGQQVRVRTAERP
jgi:HlyD family secretion protein